MSSLKVIDRPPQRYRWRVASLLLILLAANNCWWLAIDKQPDPGFAPLDHNDPDYPTTLQVRYLGNGGYLLQVGNDVIMTAVTYTSPGIVRVGIGTIKPNTTLIDRIHPRMPLDALAGILVGHAHYDHMLDVPYIVQKFHPRTRIWGGPSVLRIAVLPPYPVGANVRVLDSQVHRRGNQGSWVRVPGTHIRFTPIATVHNDHLPHVQFMKGEWLAGLKRLPKWSMHWKEGETLAYLIDFMDNQMETVRFRVYYSDVAPPDGAGLPPVEVMMDEHPIDLALLCVGLWKVSKGYPAPFLTAHQPRLVIAGHWESIFRNPAKGPKRLFNSDLKTFATVADSLVINDNQWLLANPGSIYRLDPAPATP